MAIVNFAVPAPLDERIGQAMKERGIVSKAEFFRFAAFHFLEHICDDQKEDDEYERVMNELGAKLRTYVKSHTLPSLEEQFADLR